MNREQTLQALSDKNTPIREEIFQRFVKVDTELRDFDSENASKIQQINDYFDALDNIERMQELLDNPPII
jgi:hypothetical protein